MAKERAFPLKTDSNGRLAVKETLNKHITGEQSRTKVVFALDSDLRIVAPSIYLNGVFVSSGTLSAEKGISIEEFIEECKRENKALFYPMNTLTYVVVQQILEERGEVIKNQLSLFIPASVKGDKLMSVDVSVNFPYQARHILASNCLTYALSRVN